MGCQCPSLGDLPDPGIEPESFASPALAGSSLPLGTLKQNQEASGMVVSGQGQPGGEQGGVWVEPAPWQAGLGADP